MTLLPLTLPGGSIPDPRPSPSRRRTAIAIVLAALTLLAGCAAPAGVPRPPRPTASATPAADGASQRPCPAKLPAGTRCLSGRDETGAYWWIAVPTPWSGVLVLHAHGGPELGAPKAERTQEDLERWAVMLRAGHAWAGSSYRQGGVAVHSAAEDTERLRGLFSQQVGLPRRTILHGQSWGASVAAAGAAMFPGSVDGLLLSSGVLGGGTRSYDFRLDLRVIYQALCHNHPRPDEPAYPLWQGLPPGSPLTRAELARRVDECTGVQHPAAERTREQQRKLDTLLGQTGIPETALIPHLNWGTWHFQDIVFHRLQGRNPFGNIGAVYKSGEGQDALNAAVARYTADPAAVAAFGADTDPSGAIDVPVVSLRGAHDATAFVELDSVFRETMTRAGRADRLVQTTTDESPHSYLNDAEYIAALDALLAWVDRGDKPTPQSIAAHCPDIQARFGGACRFLPDYRATPLDSRVAPRQR